MTSTNKETIATPTIPQIRGKRDLDRILRRPRELEERLAKMFERINLLGYQIISITMHYSPDKVHSENHVTKEDRICEKLDLEERYKKMQQQLEKARECIIDLCSKYCTDEKERWIVIYRWAFGETAASIAKLYGISERSVYRMCNRNYNTILHGAQADMERSAS